MALLLRKRGVARIRPLAGGLQGWLDRGLPTVGVPLPQTPARGVTAVVLEP